jgi:large subunit ribosomal protein L4
MTMPTLPLYDTTGSQTGDLEVSAHVFAAPPNEHVLHQVIVAGQAARRQGTAHTKTRAEVAGSGRKLWRQKGTGRARVGDSRPPSREGGGVAAGPRMRSYRQRVSRRLRAEALRSALSARAHAGELTVVEAFDLPEPKTYCVAEILRALGVAGTALLVLPEPNETIWRCARNIPGLRVRGAAEVNSLDVMAARRVLVTKDAIARLEARLS